MGHRGNPQRNAGQGGGGWGRGPGAPLRLSPTRFHRRQKYFISGKGPNDAQFQLLLVEVTVKEWIGLGLTAGLWQFEGYATNKLGPGPVSEVVSFSVPAAAAAGEGK